MANVKEMNLPNTISASRNSPSVKYNGICQLLCSVAKRDGTSALRINLSVSSTMATAICNCKIEYGDLGIVLFMSSQLARLVSMVCEAKSRF